jgi:abequosyltransferase
MCIKLSICIATFNRGKFISETLDSIIKQLEPNVEIVVVDGASQDNTSKVMNKYVSQYPQIRYFQEAVNSGVDADFDKAVDYAKGEFCWLMTDDDLLMPDAIGKVLASISDKNDLIIINSELRNLDLSIIYDKNRLKIDSDINYCELDGESFFKDTASYLSFIGCVVVRKQFWLSRDRESYYGTLFVHVGVIFQTPSVQNVIVLAKPLIIVRYGNAMWTPRSFEIWTFKWPKLIWSFDDFSPTNKEKVNKKDPWNSWFYLFYYRGLGAYNVTEFRRLLPKNTCRKDRIISYLISVFPASLANFLLLAYFSFQSKKQTNMVMHDFIYAPCAGFLSRFLAQILSLKSF